jgi:phage N-6-adenine-methyltransferase
MAFVGRNRPNAFPRDDVDDRRTPDDLFSKLNGEHRFTLDAAANDENHKCDLYFTRESDGLAQSWAHQTVWCNPPYSDLLPWVRKALDETESGCPKAVLLVPANRTEQAWWQDYIEPNRECDRGVATHFIRGRVSFGNPDNSPSKSPPFGVVLIVFTKPKLVRVYPRVRAMRQKPLPID